MTAGPSPSSFPDQFRRLVRRHCEGQLSRSEYLELRRQLIESAESAREDSALPTEGVTGEDLLGMAGQETGSSATEVQHAPVGSPTFARWLPAVIVIGLFALVTAVWMSGHFVNSVDGHPDKDAVEVPLVALGPAETERVRQLLLDFVDAPEWSDESVRKFLSDWSDLHPTIRQTVMASSWYGGAVVRLRSRINKMTDNGGRRSVQGPLLRELERRFEERERVLPAS